MSVGHTAVEGPSETEVLARLRQIIIDVIGEDYLMDIEIGMETGFEADLELESIEFVALAERVQEHFPDVDFVEWVAGMELEQLMTLKVGQLVEYIRRCR